MTSLSVAVLVGLPALSGCASIHHRIVGHNEAPVVYGPPVRNNITPLTHALACFGNKLKATGRVYSVGVGDVKDYTGKYAQNEGAEITQGGALMVYSALGKLGDPIRIEERFDTRIAEAELAYTDRRQLGDGQRHDIGSDGKGGDRIVPWVPYYGGTIMASDYYIVGGITELNYNIQSGGAEIRVDSIGPKSRVFTMNVAVDLRIVDTHSLVVVKTASVEKQITGYEVGFGIFRFFGDTLWDVNAGAKSQEPLQLGVRTTLELAVLQLVSAVSHVDYGPCLPRSMAESRPAPSAMPAATAPAPYSPPAASYSPPPSAPAASSSSAPINSVSSPSSSTGSDFQVAFESGQMSLGGTAEPIINQVVTAVSRGSVVNLMLVARDSETWSPSTWSDVIAKRVSAVTEALVARGVAARWVNVTWTRLSEQSGGVTQMTRDGPGYQEIAKLQINSHQ